MRIAAFLFTTATLVVACNGSSSMNDAGAGACAQDLSVGWTDYSLCAAGTDGNLGTACPPITPAPMCINSRPVAACCAWVENPQQPLALAPSTLHYNGAPPGDTTVDLSCITTPPTPGTPQMVTLNGFLKVFLGQDGDSAGVSIQLYNEGPNGSLGATIGSPVVTTTSSMSQINTWLQNCPTNGCVERAYSIPNVPTETPIIIHTSDAGGGGWADFYEYNIYFSNASVSMGAVSYDTTAVGTTDIATVTATVGYEPVPNKGLLAGEVHDCSDVRLSAAMVNTDYRPEGDVFYFGSDETDPLPDTQAVGTSDLGLFGAVNYTVGVPIHISAVGLNGGQLQLIGAYTVQVFAGAGGAPAVTGLALRGRRPQQVNGT